MLRLCTPEDFSSIHRIINDGAEAYRGVIPADRWSDPYMSHDKLQHEIAAGVLFYGVEREGSLAGVMGIQHVQDVTLIRHAYVQSNQRRTGIGGELLATLMTLTDKPILIGTWAAATWAIDFYAHYGFAPVPEGQKTYLLGKYWQVPARQVVTSVVLSRGNLPALTPDT